jgi:hypothetical protein
MARGGGGKGVPVAADGSLPTECSSRSWGSASTIMILHRSCQLISVWKKWVAGTPTAPPWDSPPTHPPTPTHRPPPQPPRHPHTRTPHPDTHLSSNHLSQLRENAAQLHNRRLFIRKQPPSSNPLPHPTRYTETHTIDTHPLPTTEHPSCPALPPNTLPNTHLCSNDLSQLRENAAQLHNSGIYNCKHPPPNPPDTARHTPLTPTMSTLKQPTPLISSSPPPAPPKKKPKHTPKHTPVPQPSQPAA